MPQVKVSSNAKGDIQPYGVVNTDNKLTLQERLLKLFQPHEFVTVINIDDQPLIWQYMPEHNENISFSEDLMHRIVDRAQPEVWQLDPGESEVIVGASAYLMLDNLYKRVVAKKAVDTMKVKEGQARNFNFMAANQMDKFINSAYLGKTTPTFNSASDVEEDLNIDDTAIEKAKSLVAGTAKKI